MGDVFPVITKRSLGETLVPWRVTRRTRPRLRLRRARLAVSARRCSPWLLRKESDNFSSHSGNAVDIDSMSRGSTSPDLGDLWRQGCPESPQWEGGLELDSDGDERDSADESSDGGPKECLSPVCDSPLWVSIRDFLYSA